MPFWWLAVLSEERMTFLFDFIVSYPSAYLSYLSGDLRALKRSVSVVHLSIWAAVDLP